VANQDIVKKNQSMPPINMQLLFEQHMHHKSKSYKMAIGFHSCAHEKNIPIDIS
jgi:hypothetical protein